LQWIQSELIVDIQDMPVAGSGGQALLPTIARVEQHAGVTVERKQVELVAHGLRNTRYLGQP
jgi:hypothetical protein